MARSYNVIQYEGGLLAVPQNAPSRRRKVIISALSFFLLIIIPIILILTFKHASPASGNEQGSVGGGTAAGPPNTSNQTSGPASSPPGTAGPSPTSSQTARPTSSPTASPTGDPTASPTSQPVTYRPGHLTVEENGLLLSEGLASRIIARSGQNVIYHNGTSSAIPFHAKPDFGATFSMPGDDTDNPGGWVYVSNSEMQKKGRGGVGALMFDKDGNVIDYRMLLEGTTANCAGGKTPWETWVSCEEVEFKGEIYQVDPFGRRQPEKLTLSTMQGGRYEAFTYDDRNKTKPRFYATEDQKNGPTRRFTPNRQSIDWDKPWEMLHGNGTLEYLVLTPNDMDSDTGTYEWIDNVHEARKNARQNYPSTEGIDRKGNYLYITLKSKKLLYILDLDNNTYIRYSTVHGLFDGQPDQLQCLTNSSDEIIYFNEDQGRKAGVHGRNKDGQFFTILEGPGWSSETTGLAFDPSGMHMYVAFQNSGVLFDIYRTDGHPFQGMTLDVRYHNDPVGPAFRWV